MINKDIERTYANVDFFQNPINRLKIFRVLKAYALLDDEVGYLQGMNYAVACLFFELDVRNYNDPICINFEYLLFIR